MSIAGCRDARTPSGFVIAVALSLVSCASSPDALGPGTKESTSTPVGAVTGAVLGGLLGKCIGAALDQEEKRCAYAAQMDALDKGAAGAPVSWQNPGAGHHGTVIPGLYYDENGRRCHSYTHSVYINGSPVTGRRTACRDPDHKWKALTYRANVAITPRPTLSASKSPPISYIIAR